MRATISAPLLQNAQYATQVRKVSAHTRNRQTGRGKYGLILHSSTVQGNMAKFPGRRVIWFDMAAITLKTKEQAKYVFLFTTKMPHMNNNDLYYFTQGATFNYFKKILIIFKKY